MNVYSCVWETSCSAIINNTTWWPFLVQLPVLFFFPPPPPQTVTGNKDQKADNYLCGADGRTCCEPACRLGIYIQRDLPSARQQNQTYRQIWLFTLRHLVWKGTCMRIKRSSIFGGWWFGLFVLLHCVLHNGGNTSRDLEGLASYLSRIS